ncbi:MAG TPA: GNAT family N-acetyltransferase [Acidimicrobiales bacterium]|nr:GNAT family N-acetyltransferase [Acidimicrobiales bacterium]
MQIWTVRIELDDRCGQLAPLVGSIAGLGASIVDLDVHRVGGGRVADDIVIEVPVPIDAPLLAGTLERAGARVVWLRPADPRSLTDRTAGALDLAAAALHQPGRTRDVLAATAARLLRAEVAWAGPVPGCEPPPLAADALATGTPSRGRLPTKRLLPAADGAPPWALAVPVEVPGAPRSVVVLVRTTPAFSFTETARVQALLRLLTAVAPAGATAPVVHLDDGGQVVLRDLGRSDAAALVRLHARCSETTRYRRYFSPKPRLGPAVLDDLVAADGRDHIAVAAVTGTEILGAAHLHRSTDTPRAGELAVLVEDGHHRRGIGTALLRELLDRAAEAGLDHVEALTLPDNDAIARLVRRVAGPVRASLADGIRRLDIAVPARTR